MLEKQNGRRGASRFGPRYGTELKMARFPSRNAMKHRNESFLKFVPSITTDKQGQRPGQRREFRGLTSLKTWPSTKPTSDNSKREGIPSDLFRQLHFGFGEDTANQQEQNHEMLAKCLRCRTDQKRHQDISGCFYLSTTSPSVTKRPRCHRRNCDLQQIAPRQEHAALTADRRRSPAHASRDPTRRMQFQSTETQTLQRGQRRAGHASSLPGRRPSWAATLGSA